MNKRITIKEVAQQAGVSTQTVSRVVNNEARVADETRERVQAVIASTGYRPNRVARALIRGHTNTIGIVTSGISYFGSSQTIRGIEQEARRLGYNITLVLLQELSRDTIANTLAELQTHNVAGIIWTPQSHIDIGPDMLHEQLRSVAVPLVANGIQPLPDIATVRIDGYYGGGIATRHLIEQGYRRIAIITGPQSQWSACERLRGWRDALHEAGMQAPDSYVEEGDWLPPSGDAALRRLLARHPDIDAVFVGNDEMAAAVLAVSAELGRSVPHDLGVVGYDDLAISPYLSPALTTVKQDITQVGKLAMQLLDEQVRASGARPTPAPHNSNLEPRLIIRASSQRTA